MFQDDSNEEKLVWYDEILDDLKLVTYLDSQLTDEERGHRGGAAFRLREKGIVLPRMSLSQQMPEEYANRQKVRGAVEFLRDRSLTEFIGWKSRGEALEYLESLGIEAGERTESEPDLSGEDFEDEPESARYPLKPGAVLKPFPEIKIAMKMLLVPGYTETDDFLYTKSLLEEAGVDVEAVLASLED